MEVFWFFFGSGFFWGGMLGKRYLWDHRGYLLVEKAPWFFFTDIFATPLRELLTLGYKGLLPASPRLYQ